MRLHVSVSYLLGDRVCSTGTKPLIDLPTGAALQFIEVRNDCGDALARVSFETLARLDSLRERAAYQEGIAEGERRERRRVRRRLRKALTKAAGV